MQSEFYSLVEQSNQETLDLRGVRTIEWDELVIWTPYANICDYGIEGYGQGSLNCASSNDDGECYLLFLKANHLAGKIKIYRPKIDLATSELDGPISKERAVFVYKTKGEFPKVILKDRY